MTSASICHHPNRLLICRELLQKLFIAFRDNLQGKSQTIEKFTDVKSYFSCRELSFKKGDIIYIRRQIDKNWYEGEHNAMYGLLPVQYVDVSRTFRPSINHTLMFDVSQFRLFQMMAQDQSQLPLESPPKVRLEQNSTSSPSQISSCL